MQTRHLPFYETARGKEVYENCLETVNNHFPQYLAEIKGIAEGADVPFEQVWVISTGLGSFCTLIPRLMRNVFPWMKIVLIWFMFHRRLLLNVQLTTLAQVMAGSQAIGWTNDDINHCHIYTSPVFMKGLLCCVFYVVYNIH